MISRVAIHLALIGARLAIVAVLVGYVALACLHR